MGIERKGPKRHWLDVHLLVAGRSRRIREMFHGSKAEAEDRYLELRRQLRGREEESSLKSFSIFEEVLSFYRERCEERSSYVKNRYILERLTETLGNTSIDELRHKFGLFIDVLKRDTVSRFGRRISKTTINRYIMYAKAACNLAVRFELIPRNPLDVYSRQAETGRDRMLSDEERNRLLYGVREAAPHLLPAVQFAMQVPIRKSELVNLKRDSLFLKDGVIRLHNGTTKNGRGVFIPIPPNMHGYFWKLPLETEYLFYRIHGGQYRTLGDFKHAWTRAKRCGRIEDFRFHDLRHYAATMLVDNGTPERVVREIANWKTDMLNRYYHMRSKRILESVRFEPNPGHLLDTSKVKAA